VPRYMDMDMDMDMVRTVRPRLARVPRTCSEWRLGASCPAPLVRTVQRPRDARVSIYRRQEARGAVCEQESRGGVSRPRRRCEPRDTAVERADAHEDEGNKLVRDEARRLRQPRPAACAPEERDEPELRRHGEATGDAGNGKGRAPGGDW
jgi:hypothetical protein